MLILKFEEINKTTRRSLSSDFVNIWGWVGVGGEVGGVGGGVELRAGHFSVKIWVP